ncbi:hypothetical protein ACQ4PT_014248 [Festuca glaucescens]
MAMDGSLSWVPHGMDNSSATRIDVRVCAYAEVGDDGAQNWHSTRNELKVLDRDCVNFKDFSEALDQEIKHGLNQKLLITFWDKISNSFAEINHDTSLLTTIDMYWDERRLPIMATYGYWFTPGLVISIDAGKGIDAAVTQVFTNGVEHRECMRHLVKNFMKKIRGDVLLKHLWPACRAYRILRFEQHYNPMLEACPEAIQWLEDNHKHLWKRYQFSEISKVDYVTNNIAESFNSWIRTEKSFPVIPLFDRIRQLIMEKMDLRRRLSYKLCGKILPRVLKDVNAKSRGLPYAHTFSNRDQDNSPLLAEVQGVDKDLQLWRHTLDLTNRTCTCRQWQVTSLPCYHAVHVITSMRNPKMEDYIDDYYSVHKFKKAYENWVGPMTDRNQWPKVDLGFKLWPPILKRAAGRPRTRRYKGWEGGKTRRTVTCKRCHQKGHLKKTCNETVLDPNAPPPAPPKPKRVRNRSKKKAIEVQTKATQVEAPPSAHVEATTPSKASTPTTDISSPMTRSRQRQLDLDSAAIHGMCTPTKQLAFSVDSNSPVTRSRKKQLDLDAAMCKASKVAAKPKAMKKTARKLEVKKPRN